MIINPADTLRPMWQANLRIGQVVKNRFLSHLYKGAGANGARQFGTWLGFPLAERFWSRVVEKTTSVDPHSISGIVLKCLPQSFQITVPIWIFERLKNELQYHPTLNQSEKKTYRYLEAFKYIMRLQGWRGFVPKTISNAILVIGADYLLEQGRRAHKVKAV